MLSQVGDKYRRRLRLPKESKSWKLQDHALKNRIRKCTWCTEEQDKSRVCFDFASGRNCRKGDLCRFSHSSDHQQKAPNVRHASVDPEGNDSSEEYSDILGLEAPFLGVALGLFPGFWFLCGVCTTNLIYPVVESLTLSQETSVSTHSNKSRYTRQSDALKDRREAHLPSADSKRQLSIISIVFQQTQAVLIPSIFCSNLPLVCNTTNPQLQDTESGWLYRYWGPLAILYDVWTRTA